MPQFLYRAVTQEGEEFKGELEARDSDSVVRQLQSKGLIPLLIEPAAQGKDFWHWLKLDNRRHTQLQQVYQFTQELSELMHAGLSLDRALTIMLQVSPDPAQQALLKRVQEGVQKGRSLSKALQEQDGLFTPFYVSMVHAAESAGSLDTGLADMAAYMERSKALREKVTSALLYPMILLVVAILSLIIILTYVIPQFEQLFADMGQALPLPTRVVMAVADFIQAFGPWVLIGLVLVGIGARRYLKDPEARLRLDSLKLDLPLVGGLNQRLETARFSRSLGTLLRGGVPMVSALQIARDTLSNAQLIEVVRQATEEVRAGRRLADPLQASGRFPLLAIQMIRVGEETGELDEMLLKIADLYDREVGVSIQRMLTILEPLMIVGLGLMIAGIIMSILVAIMSINELPL
ncbi:type II secretion system F family protein [Marinobacterium sediminicola]|uniref:General secretion pathway protein F n=1 Tax=Marinobacterium sediminicola TaxID=518898 RepID=A0ABY1S514_9GAMM|nr:type II secretion system F family protein [Marinobacterium sediminicola]ULG68430.1 type II secretion system F family protein [Marinobacterium sediminicola]SMR78504.1 general secretion pathway protein F [Marinobacterium sediminicola]